MGILFYYSPGPQSGIFVLRSGEKVPLPARRAISIFSVSVLVINFNVSNNWGSENLFKGKPSANALAAFYIGIIYLRLNFCFLSRGSLVIVKKSTSSVFVVDNFR